MLGFLWLGYLMMCCCPLTLRIRDGLGLLQDVKNWCLNCLLFWGCINLRLDWTCSRTTEASARLGDGLEYIQHCPNSAREILRVANGETLPSAQASPVGGQHRAKEDSPDAPPWVNLTNSARAGASPIGAGPAAVSAKGVSASASLGIPAELNYCCWKDWI